MIYVLVIIHALIAIALVISILLQSGRGGGLAGAFGGTMGGGSVFGGRGAGDFLAKVTAGLAIAFVVFTILINVISTRTGTSQTSAIAREASKQAPMGGSGGMPQTSPPGGGGLPESPPSGGGSPAGGVPPTGSGLPEAPPSGAGGQ